METPNATLPRKEGSTHLLKSQAQQIAKRHYYEWLEGIQAETGEPNLSKLDTPTN